MVLIKLATSSFNGNVMESRKTLKQVIKALPLPGQPDDGSTDAWLTSASVTELREFLRHNSYYGAYWYPVANTALEIAIAKENAALQKEIAEANERGSRKAIRWAVIGGLAAVCAAIFALIPLFFPVPLIRSHSSIGDTNLQGSLGQRLPTLPPSSMPSSLPNSISVLPVQPVTNRQAIQPSSQKTPTNTIPSSNTMPPALTPATNRPPAGTTK